MAHAERFLLRKSSGARLKLLTTGSENAIQIESQSRSLRINRPNVWASTPCLNRQLQLHWEMFLEISGKKLLAPARQPLTPPYPCVISKKWNAPHISLNLLHIMQAELILAGMCWVLDFVLLEQEIFFLFFRLSFVSLLTQWLWKMVCTLCEQPLS